jgi:hypothetical protein
VAGERTSPCAGAIPDGLASREKQTVCSSRSPGMRSPSPAAASIWRRGRAGDAGFAPSTAARVDTRDTPAPADRGLALRWGQETEAVGGALAAGAARGPARAAPGGPGARATPNGGAAGSRWARYAAGSAGGMQRQRGSGAVGGCHGHRLSTERAPAPPPVPAGADA